MMNQACCCMGAQPGHLLCPCAERQFMEMQRLQAMGVPTINNPCPLMMQRPCFIDENRIPSDYQQNQWRW